MPVLLMEVTEIKGRCPIYKTGDKIAIDRARIDLNRTDNYGRFAYIQCLDSGNPYTEGGTVAFKCYPE